MGRKKRITLNDRFHQFAWQASEITGSPIAFFLCVLLIVVWALSGPIMNYSDTWQLTINTLTTVVTFIMVFIIQNTQNRETRAIQLKLDELIEKTSKARNELIDLEDMSEEDFKKIKAHFEKKSKK